MAPDEINRSRLSKLDSVKAIFVISVSSFLPSTLSYDFIFTNFAIYLFFQVTL